MKQTNYGWNRPLIIECLLWTASALLTAAVAWLLFWK